MACSNVLSLFVLFLVPATSALQLKQITLQNTPVSNTYIAPLYTCPESGEDPVKFHEVYLRPGYAFSQHIQTIGSSVLKPRIARNPRFPWSKDDEAFYVGREIDRDLLLAIRSNAGVAMVYCSTMAQEEMHCYEEIEMWEVFGRYFYWLVAFITSLRESRDRRREEISRTN